MQVSANSNSVYTSNVNKTSASKEVDKEDKGKAILTVKELLGEEGNAFFNELLVGMPDEEKILIKLVLSFQMSIKNESVIDGKLHIERETGELDTQSVLSKLERLAKSKNRTDEMNYVITELQAFYTNKSELNTNTINKENLVVDDFLEDLYSNESIKTASTLVKEDMKNKVDAYAKTLLDEMDDTKKSQILNDYKHDLLNEYEEILEAINDEIPSLKQQGIMKVLLDKNNKATSSLALLLTQKIDSVQSEDTTKGGANYYMKSLDLKGNEIVNNIISGRTDTEKFAIKAIMDRGLNFKNTEAYSMAVDAFNEYNSKSDVDISITTQNEFRNKETFLDTLDAYIENEGSSVDELGIFEIAKQLKEEYLSLSTAT